MRLGWCFVLCGCGRIGFGGAASDDGVSTSDDAHPGGDAIGDQQVDAPLCTSLAQLTYNFDGSNSALWMPYMDPGISLSESGNHLVIPLPDNRIGTAGYFSTCNYDLRGQRVFVTGAVVPRVGTRTDMYLAVGSQNDTFGINVTSGSTQAYRLIGNSYTQLASVTYDAAQHKVWQIRESGGQVFYEVSADGMTFTALYSGAPPFNVSSVQLLLFADTIMPITNPGSAEFAKLDLP
jgi:hypothetical protein